MSSNDKQGWDFHEGDEIVPGRYALKKLGGGSAYEAYIVYDETMGTIVVAKMLRPDKAQDESYLKSLRREAEILGGLSHPVIVRAFDLVDDGERPHLILEHLEGETLRRLIRFGPVPMEQLLPLALSICSAIHYLAGKEIVHLDIKSRNIVMGVPPRLIDFSVARTIDRANRITGHVGTDAYMAPEQCDPGNRGEIGPWTDVWGLGAALYRAANARVPFPRPKDYDKDDLKQRFPQLDSSPEPFREDLPPMLAEVILSCLDPEPANRPEAMEVAASLEPLVAVLPRKPVLRKARPGRRY
ncbi:MAG: serine/threonine-protein kinase [Actinomycetota bacterium]